MKGWGRIGFRECLLSKQFPTYYTTLLPGLNATIAEVLQKEATPQDFLDHIDIADWLLRTRERVARW